MRRTGEDILNELKELQKRCRCVVLDPSLDDELMTPQELRTRITHARRVDAMIAGITKAGN